MFIYLFFSICDAQSFSLCKLLAIFKRRPTSTTTPFILFLSARPPAPKWILVKCFEKRPKVLMRSIIPIGCYCIMESVPRFVLIECNYSAVDFAIREVVYIYSGYVDMWVRIWSISN